MEIASGRGETRCARPDSRALSTISDGAMDAPLQQSRRRQAEHQQQQEAAAEEDDSERTAEASKAVEAEAAGRRPQRDQRSSRTF